VFVDDLKRACEFETKTENSDCWDLVIRNPQAHVPFTLTDTCQLYLVSLKTGRNDYIMSDAATTALFAPVAAALAQNLSHALEAYVVTVAMAAVTACLTPIGHHGNLLIYGV
jgi:hypothetical protein